MSTLPSQVFTTQEIKYIEQEHAKSKDGHCYDLMEKAGRAVFDEMRKVNSRPNMVYVLVGRGNNGGDGYIVAANLLRLHIPFRLFAIGQPKEESEAFTAFSYFKQLGGKIEYALPDLQYEENCGNSPDIVIDALLGTGLDSEPRSPYDEWIDFINSTKAYTISIDVPTGVNADTGKVYTDSVVANKTVCMIGLKTGLLTGDAVDYVGELTVHDLGIDCSAFHGSFDRVEDERVSILPTFLTTYEDIKSDLPQRAPSYHKGNSGKVVVIGGSHGMGGAICICGMGALRAGAGLVKVVTNKANIYALLAVRPELMTVDIVDHGAVQAAIDWADVIAIGPGLGMSANAEKILDMVMEAEKPTIIDADAINIIAALGSTYLRRSIFTPHVAEAARLLNCTPDEVNADRFKAVVDLQKKCGGVVLLKGAGSLICDGKWIYIVREGSPAMASGGMGDLLTGIIAALKAQGLTQMQATIAGACIHGRAGSLAGDTNGMIGTLALDLLPFVRYLVNKRPGLAIPLNGQSEIGSFEAMAKTSLLD